MIVFISVLVAIVGVLMYALSTKPKLQEIGRIAFFCGLLTFLLRVEPAMVNLLGR